KLGNNTLNGASQHFLGETKEDLPYWLLEREFNRGAPGRTRIARYCLKDAWLTWKLLDRLRFLWSFIAHSNMSAMSIQSCMDRASGARVTARLQFESFGS